MRREEVTAIAWACAATAICALPIVVGSRRLARFDAALVAYTFASLFSVLRNDGSAIAFHQRRNENARRGLSG